MHEFAKLAIPQGSIGIHWFEQNAYAIKDSQGTTILIDPYFPSVRPAEVFIHPLPPLVEAELPTDWVLLTHADGDHTNSETIARIHQAWPQARYVGPHDAIAKIVRESAVDPSLTIVISDRGSVSLNAVQVFAFYSKPPAGDPQASIPPPKVVHLGYVLALEGRKLYNTGDLINNFADHDELIAPIAEMKPEIGFLTTHPTEGEFPFFEGSVRMAQKLGLKTAVPSHYACFVKRTYDPRRWAALLPAGGPKPLIIPWNSHVIYSG